MPSRISAETAARIAPVWSEICERIAAGELVQTVAVDYGLSRAMLWAFRAGDDARMKEWAGAMVGSADAYFDEAIETARNPEVDPKRARVLCNVLMLAAEKRDPDRYAQRSRHDLNIKTLDLGPILARAEARLAASRVIEGEVLRPALTNDATQQTRDLLESVERLDASALM